MHPRVCTPCFDVRDFCSSRSSAAVANQSAVRAKRNSAAKPSLSARPASPQAQQQQAPPPPPLDTHETLDFLQAQKSKKGEPGGSPFLRICCVVSEARWLHVCFASDAHRKSGVFSFGAALSPVESWSLRSSMSSRLPCTLQIGELQAKSWRIRDFHNAEQSRRVTYLMNRTSRSWSRPTNDFMVRKRPKRS